MIIISVWSEGMMMPTVAVMILISIQNGINDLIALWWGEGTYVRLVDRKLLILVMEFVDILNILLKNMS